MSHVSALIFFIVGIAILVFGVVDFVQEDKVTSALAHGPAMLLVGWIAMVDRERAGLRRALTAATLVLIALGMFLAFRF